MDEFRIAMIAPVLNAGVLLEDIGICYITAVLRQNGFNVKLMSFMEKDLDLKEILEFRPDMIGVPTYNQTLDVVFEICKNVKKELPSVYTCVGGNTATFYTKEILEDASFIDFAILGEGEMVFLELAKSLCSNSAVSDIKGLAYRNKGEIIINERRAVIENLDDLPFPSRDILIRNNLRIAIMSGSRGCTNNCYFCCSHSFWKNSDRFQWRGRSAKSVVDELEYLHNEMDIKQFWFSDPSFEDPGFNEQRIRSIAEEIITRGLKISYIVYFRATFYKKASDELMQLLVRSGLSSVFVGTESVNSSDLKAYGKRATVEDNINSIAFFNKYNISVEIGFINFNPYSTFEGLRENADFLERFGYYVSSHHVSRVMVFKGSRLYDKLKADNLLEQEKFNDLYGYKYVDKRVEVLAKFIAAYFSELEKKNYVFEQISLLTHLHQARIAQFKRHFCVDENGDVGKIVAVHQQKLNCIAGEYNSKVGVWFKKMLDLAENNWDYTVAKELSDTTFDQVYLQKLLEILTSEKMVLLRNLGRVNKEYTLYF